MADINKLLKLKQKRKRHMIVLDARGNVRLCPMNSSAPPAEKDAIVRRACLLALHSPNGQASAIVTSTVKRGKAMKQLIFDENFTRRRVTVPLRASLKGKAACKTTTPAQARRKPRPRIVALLVGVGLMLLLLVGFSRFVQPAYERWQAGEDRVQAFRLNVGHGPAPSDFLTQYREGEAIIIEFPGGKIEKSRIYTVLVKQSDTSERTVTLQIGTGAAPHLFVWVEGLTAPYVLYNTGETFSHSLPVPKEEKKQ